MNGASAKEIDGEGSVGIREKGCTCRCKRGKSEHEITERLLHRIVLKWLRFLSAKSCKCLLNSSHVEGTMHNSRSLFGMIERHEAQSTVTRECRKHGWEASTP